MFDRCVCFGLLSTLDDNLDRTFILSYRTFSSADASHLLIPTDRFLHSPFQRMYVRAAAERSLSGTPVHLLLVDAPNHAISMDEFFHAGLEPLRAFVCSYPMDVLLRASGQDCCPINGIMSESTSAFMDQPRLCYRKHRSLQHHPCFRAMTNLPPRIGRPQCFRSRATGTPVASTANRKRNALLSALF